jgi:hypothetical protein
MSPATHAMKIDAIPEAKAAFNSKAIHVSDSRSAHRQNGRIAQLPRNIKVMGTASSSIDSRLVKSSGIEDRKS